MGKSPKLSTIPTWRTPVTADWLPWWEVEPITSSHWGVPGPAWALMTQCAASAQVPSYTKTVTTAQASISSWYHHYNFNSLDLITHLL